MNAISWSSKKHKITTLSSEEAEYVSATEASCEAIWLRRFLFDLEHIRNDPTIIYCDNNSAIAMTENPVFHNRTKHIKLCYHFIRDLIQEKENRLNYVSTYKQVVEYIHTVSVRSSHTSEINSKLQIKRGG